jgi:hypothetical protein
MNNDEQIFKGKTFSELLSDIYKNSIKKEHQLTSLISELKPFMKTAGDVVLIVPLVKDFMELSIKNDEHLIKMAAIVQRSLNRSANGEDGSLSDDEKKQLLATIQEIQDQTNQ